MAEATAKAPLTSSNSTSAPSTAPPASSSTANAGQRLEQKDVLDRHGSIPPLYSQRNEPAFEQADFAGHYPDLPSPRAPKGLKFGFLKLDECDHFLKLRHRVQVNEKLSAELGLDYGLNNATTSPWFSMAYQLIRGNGKHFGVLRLRSTRLELAKPFHLRLGDRASVRIDALASISRRGKPEFGIDVNDLKPLPLVIGAAAVLLALKQPLTTSKAFGDFRVATPLKSRSTEFQTQAEARATVQRFDTGFGVYLTPRQLNAVVRF